MADEDYIIEDSAELLTVHDPFVIVTSPITHTLCGEITVDVTYDGAALTGDPVTYDSVNR